MTDSPEERAQRVIEEFEMSDTAEMEPMIEQALNERLWYYTVALFEELDNAE